MYNQIDIALETFPYNGTNDHLRIPLDGCSGRHVEREYPCQPCRSQPALHHRIGLPELIGETPADYIRIARKLSQDRRKLLDLRWTSRQRMINSDLCNKQLITTDIETATVPCGAGGANHKLPSLSHRNHSVRLRPERYRQDPPRKESRLQEKEITYVHSRRRNEHVNPSPNKFAAVPSGITRFLFPRPGHAGWAPLSAESYRILPPTSPVNGFSMSEPGRLLDI